MIKWGTTFGSHDGALAVFQVDELVDVENDTYYDLNGNLLS